MDTLLDKPNKDTSGYSVNLGGKYLTFLLDNGEYGVELLRVCEIISITDITRVPQTSSFIEGMINLRGKVIPVVDLRCKFGLNRAEYNDQTCIIVVDVGSLTGIIVDTVREVYDIPGTAIELPPQLGHGQVDTSFILGMGKVGEDVKILLNIEKVLMSEQFVQAIKLPGG